MSLIETKLDPMTIHPAVSEDLPSVMGILNQAAARLQSRGIAQWPSPMSQGMWNKMAGQIAWGQVYLAKDPISLLPIGTLRFEWEDAEFWPQDPAGGGYVHSLAVSDNAVGQGIGAKLLEWAQAHIATSGRPLIRLDCWSKNAPLCRYYEALGFRPCGIVEHRDYSPALYEKKAVTA